MATKRDVADAFDAPPRQRTTVPEKQAKAFVEAGTPAKRTKGTKLKRWGLEGDRITVYVPIPLGQRLREEAVRDRRSISDAMTEALEQWLERRAKGRE